MQEITTLPSHEASEIMRVIEALLFASAEPLSFNDIAYACNSHELENEDAVSQGLMQLKNFYSARGVNLIELEGGFWVFRTAEDLGYALKREKVVRKKMSQAALETLAIIAYHQPVTRAEIEQIRGVSSSKGSLDVLMEAGWVTLKGRRRNAVGKPVTYGTTPHFLDYFALEALDELPGVEELKGAGLMDQDPAAQYSFLSDKEQEALNLSSDSYIEEEETLDHLLAPMEP